jgi:hypothetical protein
MAVNRNYEKKETIANLNAFVIEDGKIERICDARFYMGRSSSASVVYCNTWFFPKDQSQPTLSGSGQASGWGYDKKSHALCYAMTDAQIEHERFAGMGLGQAEVVIKKWAEEQGYDVSTIYFSR